MCINIKTNTRSQIITVIRFTHKSATCVVDCLSFLIYYSIKFKGKQHFFETDYLLNVGLQTERQTSAIEIPGKDLGNMNKM